MPSQPKKTVSKPKVIDNEIVPATTPTPQPPPVPVAAVSPEPSKTDVSTPPPAPNKTSVRKVNDDAKKEKEVKIDDNDAKEDKKDGDETSSDNSALNGNAIITLVEKISSLAALIKDIQASIKPVVKEHDKLRKIVDRIQKKRENARKSPSGFAKPNKISNELCDFIGVPHGTEKSRTEITRYINAYVKEHNLNKPSNRRIILPDEKLNKILKTNNDEEVTFFILQRLISHHFPSNKNNTVVTAATVAT